jgi:hypothetical protein
MKVRWTDESLRLRITPTELRLLIAGTPLALTLHVPGGAWHVSVDPTGDALSVHADGAAMVVQLSSEDIARLAEPDREGVYAHAPGLRLMVEKDFPCTHAHPVEAAEPATERFAPTAEFTRRKSHTSGQV